MFDVTRASRNPAGYAKSDPVPAAVLIWLALVAIAMWRQGRLPDQRGALSLAVATGVVVAAASVAPRFVTLVLLAVLALSVFRNPRDVTALVERGFANVRRAVGQ